MAKYEVFGTLQYNFSIVVEADSEDEAEEWAKSYAEDGQVSFGPLVETPEISEIKKLKTRKKSS